MSTAGSVVSPSRKGSLITGTYVGFKNLNRLSEDPAFNFAIIISTVLAYFCVIIDFTKALKQKDQPNEPFRLLVGTLKDVLFCFDFLFLIDIMLAMAQKKIKLATRPTFIIYLEIISTIPAEIVYASVGGKNVRVIYGLRLRYILRLSRYLYSIFLESSGHNFSITLMVLKFTIIMSMLCIAIACFRLILWCNLGMTENSMITCENLKSWDISVVYFITNGIVTESDTLLSESFTLIVSIVVILQFSCLIILMRLKSVVICTFLDILNKKFQFAIMNNIVVELMKEIKRTMATQWSVKDMVFEEFLKKYLTHSWFYSNTRCSHAINYAKDSMPPIIRKELALDVSWNMFKHSLLFKDEEVHFLRHVSLLASYKMFMQNETLQLKGEFSNRMVYIIHGVVDVLSQDNSESPIISFDGGTCLGELSLFISIPSVTTLVCRTYCEVITLPKINFLKCRTYYPNVYRRLRLTALSRLKRAREYKLVGDFYFDQRLVDMKKEYLSLRYIKTTLRRYIGVDDKQNRLRQMLSKSYIKEVQVMDKTIFCADYLVLYVLAEGMDKSTNMHFLRTGAIFKINPNSALIEIWNFGMYIFIVSVLFIYPIGSTMTSKIHIQLYLYYMNVISVIWLIDFVMFFAFVGIEDVDVMHKDFEYIFHRRIQTLTFWLDVSSSIPIDIIINLLESPVNRKAYKLLQINRLLKAYKLLEYIKNRQFFGSKNLLLVTVLKILFTFVLLILFGFNVLAFMDENYTEEMMISKILFMIRFSFATLEVEYSTSRHSDFLHLIFLQDLVFMWKLYMIPLLIAACSLNYINTIEYENMVEDIKKVSVLYSMSTTTKKKLYKYLYMHYKCGKGLFLLKFKILVNFLGSTLYKTQTTMLHYNLFANEGLFKYLPYHIIRDINEIPQIVLIPKGEFVVYAGAHPKEIYMIIEGSCGYMAETPNGHVILKTIEAGESLMVIEVLSRVNIVHNIITLSDCKLLCISYKELLRKFLKYGNEYTTLNYVLKQVVSPNVLISLQHKEMTYFESSTKDDNKSFLVFKRNDSWFWRGYGKHKLARHFLLNATIKPYGNFWFYWEVTHIALTYMSVLIGTIPITATVGINSPFFWIFRFFDLMALADIYLRHHVFAYSNMNLEITHPFKTAIHYWKSAFSIDLLSALPLELLTVYFFEKTPTFLLVLTRSNRFLQLYRIYGLKKYLSHTYLSELGYFHLTLYICATIFSLNICIYSLHPNCVIDSETSTIFCPPDLALPFWKWHFNWIALISRHIFTLGSYYEENELEYKYFHSVTNVLGYFSLSIISGIFIGLKLFRNSYLTSYQIKMQRLIQFMSMRRIDKKLKAEIIKHYEYLWILWEGKSLQGVLNKFNSSCYEEVLFANLGNILQNSVVFKKYPRVIVKDFLSCEHLRHIMILIRGIIIRVNDVQNKIFILYKGQVEVLGPDNSKLKLLQVGSTFGCLDNVSNHRSTLTYVAKTHCELLCMETTHFYNLIRTYPTYYQHFLYLVKTSNIDYIACDHGRSEKTRDINPEHKNEEVATVGKEIKQNRLVKHIINTIKVHKPKEQLQITCVVICFITFLFEAFQKVVKLHTPVMIIICYLLDAYFWVWIYINFSTSFENEYGLWVTKRRLIAMRYIKSVSGFFFHLACNFPLELFAFISYNEEYFWVIWDILRLNRFAKIIIVFNFFISVCNRLNINVYLIRISYIFLLVITLQQMSMVLITMCNWVQATSSTYETYMITLALQTYFMSPGAYVIKREHTTSIHDEYFCTVFSGLIFITKIVLVYVLAEYVACFQVLTYSKFRFTSYMIDIDKDMKGKRISPPLHKRVINYFKSLEKTDRKVQFPSFVEQAPYYLQEGILDSMFGFLLRRHPIFKECHSDLVRQIASSFETSFFFPGDFITFIGDIDSSMYFIYNGEVECLSEDNLYYEVVYKTYKTGDSFGFRQLLFKNVGHQYTYKVSSNAVILTLRREAVLPLLDFFPASKHILHNFDRYSKLNIDLEEALK